MIPILEAVLNEVLIDPTDAETGKSGGAENSAISAKNMRAMLAMSVCMSANIGGTATTIGNFINSADLQSQIADLVGQVLYELKVMGSIPALVQFWSILKYLG